MVFSSLALKPRPAHPRGTCQRYNTGVPLPEMPVPSRESQPDSPARHRHAVYASEATGLLLIALLLLVLTLVRYWHDIHWSLR